MPALAIVIADAARARLFTWKRESADAPAPILHERADLISLERRTPPRPALDRRPAPRGTPGPAATAIRSTITATRTWPRSIAASPPRSWPSCASSPT
jgi:hypothetical protein